MRCCSNKVTLSQCTCVLLDMCCGDNLLLTNTEVSEFTCLLVAL